MTRAIRRCLPILGLAACPSERPYAPIAAETDRSCVAAWSETGPTRTVTAGSRTFEITGSRLVERSTDPGSNTMIGILANLDGDARHVAKNLETYLRFFSDAKVDLIVVAGDLGGDRDTILGVMEPIAERGVLVLALSGDRDDRAGFEEALDALRGRPVADMHRVRLAELDDVAFVSLPGTFDRASIHTSRGCAYGPEDLDDTVAIVARAGRKPVVLLSHGGPRQVGPGALDRTLDGANAGDPAMARFIREAGIRFGVFADIREAGGRATDRSGSTSIAPQTWAAELYMNPGPGGSWPMNDGTRTAGMAGLLEIEGDEAAFEMYRIRGSPPR